MKAYYVSNDSVLVINAKGKMRTLYTPFKVQCYHAVGGIPMQAWVFVDGVYQDKTDQLHYQIGGKLYSYQHFRLQVLF
jgi:hypothetical protein